MLAVRNRRELTEKDMALMGLPRRFWPEDANGRGLSFDKASDGKHKEAIRNYMRKLPEMLGNGYGLLLFGDYGTGKTSLAALVAHEARRMDAIVYFIRAFELRDAVINKRPWDEGVTVDERVRRVDLLIIDDLGKEWSETSRSWSESYFEDLLRVRTDNLKSTIITSNYTPAALSSMYKASMTAVLQSSIYPLLITGPDRREEESSCVKQMITTVR